MPGRWGWGWEGASGHNFEGQGVEPEAKHLNSRGKGLDYLPALLLTRYVTQGKFSNVSVPSFPIWKVSLIIVDTLLLLATVMSST